MDGGLLFFSSRGCVNLTRQNNALNYSNIPPKLDKDVLKTVCNCVIS